MKISLKNMIISFALSLIVFSLIMIIVCVSIYHSRIDVKTDHEGSAVVGTLVSRSSRYDFSGSHLYYETDSDNNLRFIMVAGVSTEEKIVTLTPISASHPINYRDGIYYAASIWQREGEAMLSPLAEALTGLVPELHTNVDLEDKNELDRFYEQVKQTVLDQYKGYSVERIDVILDRNGVVDNEKTVEQFFVSKTK